MASYPLFVIGNPLLDIQVSNGEELLSKYKLKANDAILAEELHEPIYDEITGSYAVAYVAGGAAQNTGRAAAYVLPSESVVFVGAVGDDALAVQLRAANDKEGLKSAYYVLNGEQTGACAVILTGHHRSLVTTLRSAEKFNKDHLSTPEIASHIDNAKYYYCEGYFLTHGTESALEVAKKASLASKVFAINLSAPFIPQFFKAQLDEILPYCDIVIGNEAEAESYANAQGLPEPKNLIAVAQAIAGLTKMNPARHRIVIITQGAESTIAVSSKDIDNPQTYPVHEVPADQIVDTNGAGDMFAGGFIAGLVLGKSLEEAVAVGQKLGAMCITQVGPQLKWPKEKVI